MKEAEITKIFLITLDEKLTQSLLSKLRKLNIHLVTLKSIKEKNYLEENSVITIEELLKICKNNSIHWINYNYSNKELFEIRKILDKKLKKYSRLQKIQDYYLR